MKTLIGIEKIIDAHILQDIPWGLVSNKEHIFPLRGPYYHESDLNQICKNNSTILCDHMMFILSFQANQGLILFDFLADKAISCARTFRD